jgi:2-oxoisovalerate dehydrogenase E1 component
VVGPVHGDEVAYCSLGDGTTSEGEFWEALNTACNLKLPVLFLVEDNGYAISVPIEVQTAGRSISKLVSGFPDLYIEEVDGCDLVASHEVLGRAIAYCRDRKGPALVHAHVVRPYSHSLSDDEAMYRSAEEREADAARDPIKRLAARLLEQGLATPPELDALAASVDAEVSAAVDAALPAPQPRPESATDFVYSPDVTRPARRSTRRTRPASPASRRRWWTC